MTQALDLQSIIPGLFPSEAETLRDRLNMEGVKVILDGPRLHIAIHPNSDGLTSNLAVSKILIRLIHRATSAGLVATITGDILTIGPVQSPVPAVAELAAQFPAIPEEELKRWEAVFSRDADHVNVTIEGKDGDRPSIMIRPLDQIGALLLASVHA